MGSEYSVDDTLDKGMVYVDGGMEWDGTRLYHATQNGMKFKSRGVVYFWSFPFNLLRMWLTVGN